MRSKCLLLAFFLPTSALAQYVGLYLPCGMTQPPVNDVQISFLDSGESDGTNRREFVQISDTLATALAIGGVHPEPEAPNPQIRVRIQSASGAEAWSIVHNNAVFTVTGIVEDPASRIWVYQQEDPGDEDSGQFKLFAKSDGTILPTPDLDGDHILDNVLARVFPSPVSRSDYTDAAGILDSSIYYCEPSTSKSYVETTIRANDDVIVVMTPHGGHTETNTSDQSTTFVAAYEALSASDVNVWDLQGRWGDGQTDERWHITSTSLLPASYPGLADLLADAGTFDYAVSFHGYSGSAVQDCGAAADQPIYEVILGGDAELNLKCAIADSIVDAVAVDGTYPGGIAIDIRYGEDENIQLPDACGRVVSTDEHSGTHEDNIVNRVSTVGGIQVEQSKTIRENPGLRSLVPTAVAQAIVLYDSDDDYCP